MRVMFAAALALVPLSAVAAEQQAAPAQGSIFDKAINQPGIGWSVYGPGQTAKQVPATDVPGGAAVRVQVSKAGANVGTSARPIRRSSRSRPAIRCW
ncbi:hypothetical protein MOP88_15165 [Sphingomonas sp. WKB10]|nr:hypothetical protein [Sphingomonas sp. WKB10]